MGTETIPSVLGAVNNSSVANGSQYGLVEVLLESVVEFDSIGRSGENWVVAASEHSLIKCVRHYDLSGWIYRLYKDSVSICLKRKTMPCKSFGESPKRTARGV